MHATHTEDVMIDVTGGRIFARTWRPGKIVSTVPVVLLHDSLGSVDLWRDFPAVLSESLSRIVIAYDRLGFGRSDARHDAPSLNFIENEAAVFPLRQVRPLAFEIHSAGAQCRRRNVGRHRRPGQGL